MEMLEKEQFYDRYGVTEYYGHDPHENELVGWRREAGQCQRIDEVDGWLSPLLGDALNSRPRRWSCIARTGAGLKRLLN